MTAPPPMGRRQRGVALVTALVIVFLVTVISAGMLSQMNLALHRSANIWQSEQAWWYAMGIENWLGKLLRQEAKRSDIDSLDERWAEPVDYLPLDGGALQGRLIDLQGRFNLNNLAGNSVDAAQAQFERLIQRVGDTDQITASTIAAATRDWIDPDINPTLPDGAEDDYYLGLSPAYRAGNARMASASELRLVKGMTPALYAALAPYVCALPEITPINVNTAAAPVLASIAPELAPTAGESLLESRADQPWESVEAFLQDPALAGYGDDIDANQLSVTTHYFLATGQITVDRAQVQFFSVLERADNGAVHTLRHSTHVD